VPAPASAISKRSATSVRSVAINVIVLFSNCPFTPKPADIVKVSVLPAENV
jgi:hypothetical protein